MTLLQAIPSTAWAWLVERVWINFTSTKIGLALIPIVFGLLALLGCDPELLMSGIVATVVGGIKILGTDRDKVAESLLDAFRAGVMDAKAKKAAPVVLLVLFLGLTACGPKAVFISGGQGSTASVEVSPVSGSGRISITGPFVYCSERNLTTDDVDAKPSGKLCRAPVVEK